MEEALKNGVPSTQASRGGTTEGSYA